MNFLIKIKDGKTVDHPIHEDNLRVFFPNLDINDPPDGYARFVRKEYPELNSFQKVESIDYVVDPDLSNQYGNTVWTDKYNIVTLTREELAEIADKTTQEINEKMMQDSGAPFPPPNDGKLYVWVSADQQWIEKPANFDDVVSRFANKLYELGLAGLTPEQLSDIDPVKRAELEAIIDELNTMPGFANFKEGVL
jgi:hypothetical protein